MYTGFEGSNAWSQKVEGDVLVTRNPMMHPGDIRKLQAVHHPRLASFFSATCGGVVIFSTRGVRASAAEMGGGDYDGDMFFVIFGENRDLIDEVTVVEPLDYSNLDNVPVPVLPAYADKSLMSPVVKVGTRGGAGDGDNSDSAPPVTPVTPATRSIPNVPLLPPHPAQPTLADITELPKPVHFTFQNMTTSNLQKQSSQITKNPPYKMQKELREEKERLRKEEERQEEARKLMEEEAARKKKLREAEERAISVSLQIYKGS